MSLMLMPKIIRRATHHGGASAASAALIAAIVGALPAHAQTTFYQSGFEASEGYSTTVDNPVTIGSGSTPITTFTPTPGALVDQPASNPLYYSFFNYGTNSTTAAGVQAAVNSTTVVNTAASTGTQSVQINGTVLGDQGVQYVVAQGLVAGTNGILNASADVRVTQPSATAYGQWGLDMTEYTGGTLYTDAAFGFVGGNVLASNDGTTIYAAFDLATDSVYTANYGAFNTYALQMNYASRTISGFFDGTQVAFLPLNSSFQPIGAPILTMPFRAGATNTITDATFGESIEGTTENANFDNIAITGSGVVAAPEPVSLSLFGVGLLGAGVLRRRSRMSA